MSRRALLSAEQRDRLFAKPTDLAEIARHYILGGEDLALIRSKRRGMNGLGIAVQLCLLRLPGQGLCSCDHLPMRCASHGPPRRNLASLAVW